MSNNVFNPVIKKIFHTVVIVISIIIIFVVIIIVIIIITIIIIFIIIIFVSGGGGGGTHANILFFNTHNVHTVAYILKAVCFQRKRYNLIPISSVSYKEFGTSHHSTNDVILKITSNRRRCKLPTNNLIQIWSIMKYIKWLPSYKN